MGSPRLSKRRLLLIGAIVLIVIALTLVFVRFQPNQPSANPTTTFTVPFDFDTGDPALVESQNTPFSQKSKGVTASFASPSDPAAFLVTNSDASTLKVSQFSGNFLYDSKSSRDILDIKFDTEIIAVNFTFATVEIRSESIPVPSDILLVAYENTTLMGSTKVYGSFSSDSYPQGTLSFRLGAPFNWIRISIPAQSSGTTDFLIDNISVAVVSNSSP